MSGWVALLAAATTAPAQIINEGFETVGTLPASSYQAFTSGSTLGDWTVTGLPGTGVDLVRDEWYDSPLGYDYWLDLAGTPGPGGITRDLLLKPGLYTLSFLAFTNRSSYQVDFGVAGVFARTISPTASGLDRLNPGAVWSLWVQEFEITSLGTYSLAFSTPQGDNGNVGLDNIFLESASDPGGQEAVPEPFTLALGAAGLIAALRRRRARR